MTHNTRDVDLSGGIDIESLAFHAMLLTSKTIRN